MAAEEALLDQALIPVSAAAYAEFLARLDSPPAPDVALGTSLRHPHTSGINGSRHDHMRELRVRHAGRPYRVLFAFDPRRCDPADRR